MSKETKKSHGFFRTYALPFAAGTAAYIALLSTSLIPKKWNIFPRVEGETFVAGLVEGFGNVRNIIASATGLLMAWGTDKGLKNSEYVRPLPKHEAIQDRLSNVSSQNENPVTDFSNRNKITESRSSKFSR